ncbi:M50 family metallopeptidase, partial [bacterium]|nr:M50 family metallopeptidase [bacterium]
MGFPTKFKLFKIAGIQVQMHSSFVIFLLYDIFFVGAKDFRLAATVAAVVWLSVLLHEFGHCFGARRVGGDAREILMWPLGGLAMCEAPQTPWAQFVTTACGPLVTLILTLIGFFLRGPLESYGYQPWLLATVLFGANLAMLIFNVVPAYPLDGGRMFQELLWLRLGYQRSLRWAVRVSFPFAIG